MVDGIGFIDLICHVQMWTNQSYLRSQITSVDTYTQSRSNGLPLKVQSTKLHWLVHYYLAVYIWLLEMLLRDE